MKTNSRFCITRTRATNSGRTVVEYLAGGEFPEFTTQGNTRTGVGVANLKTWGTVAGAQRWMDARPTFHAGTSKVGTVEIVTVIGLKTDRPEQRACTSTERASLARVNGSN